jgi:hypothetical protein
MKAFGIPINYYWLVAEELVSTPCGGINPPIIGIPIAYGLKIGCDGYELGLPCPNKAYCIANYCANIA